MESKGFLGKRPVIISLDGGGPGTISQLCILEEMQNRLAFDLKVDPDKICLADYVDLIGGTGWGGFLAIVLGHLRLSIRQAFYEVVEVARTIVPNDDKGKITPEARTRLLREACLSMLRRHNLSSDTPLFERRFVDPSCKVVVFAVPEANLNHCRPLRSYASRQSSNGCSVVDAICATMAMPLLFGSTSIGHETLKETFVGASIGFNNPTRELLKEATKLFGMRINKALVLSLGCGRPPVLSYNPTAAKESQYYYILEQASLDCERIHNELSHESLPVKRYFRLNVDRGLEHLVFANWREPGPIQSHTRAYLEQAAIEKDIDEILLLAQEELCRGQLVDQPLFKQAAFQLNAAGSALFFFNIAW